MVVNGRLRPLLGFDPAILDDEIQIPKSPVSAMLGTNLSPRVGDRKNIHKAVVDVRSDVSLLDEDIAQLQKILDTLRNKRNGMECFIERHQALLSPIRQCPPEVLVIIFYYGTCAEDGNGQVGYDKSPWIFGWICSEWRTLALNTPKLWAKPILHLRSPCKNDVDMAKEWLRRAKECPLTLTLRGGSQAATHPLMDVAVSHCERWESLKFDLSPSLLPSLAATKDRLPRLVSLSTGRKNTLPERFSVFRTAPKLTHLSLGIYQDALHLKLRWTQLTTLSFTSRSDAALTLKILKRCPNLVNCSVKFAKPLQLQYTLPPVQIPHLQALYIQGTGNLSDLFDHLFLPSMLHLHIDLCSPEREAPHLVPDQLWVPQLTSLIQRSSCCLQSVNLKLDGRTTDGSELLEFLAAVPSLTEFVIRDMLGAEFANNIIQRLAFRTNLNGTFSLVPLLKVFDISAMAPQFDDEAFMTMVWSRVVRDLDPTSKISSAGQRSSTLRVIKLTLYLPSPECPLPDPASILAPFHELRQRGTIISVRYGRRKNHK